jgi:lysophospholipase L1-like esterase
MYSTSELEYISSVVEKRKIAMKTIKEKKKRWGIPTAFLIFLTWQFIFNAQLFCQNYWESAIQEFEKADAKNPPDSGAVLFVGSSSIRMWKTVQKDFPFIKVLNRGFGGSQMSDLLYFTDRIVLKYKPSMIIVYEGDNDVASGKNPVEILGDYRAFVKKVRAKMSHVPIILLAAKPSPLRWQWASQYRLLNQLLEKYVASAKDENLMFVDIFSPMIGENGKPKPEIFLSDSLHMNEKGYQIWKKVLTPILKKQLELISLEK